MEQGEQQRTETRVSVPSRARDPQKVSVIRKAIDFGDYVGLTSFGERAQRTVTEFSSRILSNVRAHDGTDPDAILSAILNKAAELDVAEIGDPGFVRKLFSSAKSRVSTFKAKFLDIAEQIDGLAVRIEKHRVELRSDIATLETLYAETVESVRNLDDHIDAASGAISEMRETTIPALRLLAQGSQDPMLAGQEIMDAEQATDRLEKRVMQLRQARQIAFQQLPQIRIVQSGDETLIQNLGAALDLTIPAWKQKMVLMLGVTHQRNALKMDKAVADATGRLIKESARMVGSQAHEIEKRSQEGLLPTDALKEANDILINTIGGIVQKQAVGREARRDAERKIAAMGSDLEAALVGTV